MRYRFVIWFTLWIAAAPALAANLNTQLQEQVRGSDLGPTRVAFCVVDADTGQTLASYHADQPMIPASNMKLITTAGALSILGPQFVFTTELGLVEPERTDQLADLIVTGDGDPAFGDPVLLLRHGFTIEDVFEQWIAAVAATGYQQFNQLLIDDRVFDYQFVHPTWARSDQIRLYGAQVAGLNFHRNCLNIMVTPTTRGQSPLVSLYPEAPFIPTTNRSLTGTRDFFIRDRRLGTNEMTFAGQIKNRQRAPYYITIHDPPMVFGQILVHQLKKAGLTVDTVRRLASQEPVPKLTALHRVTTTLQLVLERTNQNSQNMFAEALLKRIGREITGEPGSWTNGAAALRLFLQKELGTQSASITIADGSGLSRDNRVTAQTLCRLLTIMHQNPNLAEPYRQSLSRNGEIGTLKKRLKNLPARVYGKSGFLSGVSSLSGYLVLNDEKTDAPTRTLAFSFLFNKSPINNRRLKDLQNRMVEIIVSTYRNSSP